MSAREKIREVPISITPIAGTDTVCLKLLIPSPVVDKIGIDSTKKTGDKCILYISPPLDEIKPGQSFELIYRHPGIKPENVNKDNDMGE